MRIPPALLLVLALATGLPVRAQGIDVDFRIETDWTYQAGSQSLRIPAGTALDRPSTQFEIENPRPFARASSQLLFDHDDLTGTNIQLHEDVRASFAASASFGPHRSLLTLSGIQGTRRGVLEIDFAANWWGAGIRTRIDIGADGSWEWTGVPGGVRTASFAIAIFRTGLPIRIESEGAVTGPPGLGHLSIDSSILNLTVRPDTPCSVQIDSAACVFSASPAVRAFPTYEHSLVLETWGAQAGGAVWTAIGTQQTRIPIYSGACWVAVLPLAIVPTTPLDASGSARHELPIPPGLRGQVLFQQFIVDPRPVPIQIPVVATPLGLLNCR